MNTRNTHHTLHGIHLARGLSAALAALCATHTFAADVTGNDTRDLEEVIVTGTRIVSPNMEATSPVNVVTAEEIKTGGRSDVTDFLNLLPQLNTNDIGQGLGNRTSGLSSAGGVANADLRGLGPNRTLVMVNGRRLGAGSANTFIAAPAPDLDQIPSALIERVDVLTGGASAVYGSDAVAGVVNFITKRNFEGIEVDYQRGFNWHHNHNKYAQQLMIDNGLTPVTGTHTDGKTQNLSITLGTNFGDNGNVTAFFGYLTQDPVKSGDRDFGGCQIFANSTLDGAVCDGSANSNYFVSGVNEYQVAGNQFVEWGSADTTPPAIFNSQKYIDMNRDNRRYNVGLLAHMDVTEAFKPYAEFMYMDDKSVQEIAPSALFFGNNPLTPSGGYLVNCSNPLLSDQQRNLICSPADIVADTLTPGSVSADLGIGRRNVEGGSRISVYKHTNYRFVLGTKGEFASHWNYDAYGQYYYTKFFQSQEKYLNYQSVANALQVTGTANNPVCISGGNCVPYNIFTEGAVTPAMLDYLSLTGISKGSTGLNTLHADVTGDLGGYGLKLPAATEGAGVNVGFEYRKERVKYVPDDALEAGLLAGGNAGVRIDKSQSVSEQFIELRVPLIQDKTGVHDLTFDTGFRRSDYSITGAVNTYKFEVQYAPIRDYRVRAGFQRAIRAPSLIELYTPAGVGQIASGNDPCAPTRDEDGNIIPAAATFEQCQASGVTLAQYGNGGTTNTIPQAIAAQLSQLASGNANLKAETAKTFTLGLTFQPEQIPDLTGSLDYYHIKIDDEVSTYNASVLLNGCMFGGNAFYCSQLVRNPVTGGLNGASPASGGYINQTNVNLASAETSGIDAQANYKIGLNQLGTLRLALNGSYLIDFKTKSQPDLPAYDCAGLFGPACQTVNPHWRHNLTTIWATPWKVAAALTWRHVGSVGLDNNSSDPTLNGSTFGAYNSFNRRIPAYNWFDLSARWNITDKVEVRGGINNLFDKDPPLVTSELVSGGAANTYAFYDSFGRQVFAGINAKF